LKYELDFDFGMDKRGRLINRCQI